MLSSRGVYGSLPLMYLGNKDNTIQVSLIIRNPYTWIFETLKMVEPFFCTGFRAPESTENVEAS